MRILVGYDGSNVAKAALELGKKHAKVVWGAKIDVVNCMAQNRDLQYEDIRQVEENLEGEVRCIFNSGKVSFIISSSSILGQTIFNCTALHNPLLYLFSNNSIICFESSAFFEL